jgi:hypothetical protein
MVFLCTSRPQQWRWTRMAFLLGHRRRRLHLKISLANSLVRGVTIGIPEASGATLLYGFSEPHHCGAPGSVAGGRSLSCAWLELSCSVVTESVTLQ